MACRRLPESHNNLMQEHFSIKTSDVRLPEMSDAKRALLQKYLRGGVALSSPESSFIARRPNDKPAPPSFGQEQLWIHAQMVADLLIYNEPVTVRRTGPLNLDVLKQSLNEIIRRHEAWRTNFAIQDGQLVQVINPPFDLEVPLVDLTGLAESEREAEALRLATLDARRPFDLNNGPLLRVMLARLSDTEHRLYLTLHQIIFDGVSLYSVFLPELTALYEAFTTGAPSPLPEPSIQYADFSHWQRQRAQDEALTDELEYWRKQLAGAPAALDLPTDRPRPAIQSFRGEQLSFRLSQKLSEALKGLSRKEGTTLFMTLLTAFKIVLHRYTDQDDLLVGTVTTSRKRAEFDELLGFFLNTLVLRTDLSGDPTFRQLLGQVRHVTVDALAHGDVPMHRLVKELDRERDPARNPLFQVMFVLEPPLPAPGPGWELSQVDVDAGIARVDLYLELDDRPEGLVGRFRYNSDLFNGASIDRMLDHLTTLLEGVAANPERVISDYSLTAVSARALQAANTIRPVNPFIEFGKQEIEQSIGNRFQSQVRTNPDNIAVKSSTHEWSYAELNRRANAVAQAILRRGAASEERVAILFDHDAPMIAAILGTLKAGKTYVPLDPANPAERLTQILEDCQATALLTNSTNLALARELWTAVAERSDDGALDSNVFGGSKAVSTLCSATALQNDLINIDDEQPSDDDIGLPEIEPDRLAYILYTSGSTGRPKGVMQSHRNVLHYIRVYTNNLHLNASDRLTLFSSYCFDASVMDIYGALLNGATLCPIDIKREGLAGLSQRLIDEEITVYHSTPTVYRYFVAQTSVCDHDLQNHRLKSVPLTAFPKVRLVVLGGEKATRTDVELYQKHFAENCLFVNGLGPTEATVALQNFINQQTRIDVDGIPVGFPVEDTEILLLNKAGKPSEVMGEIAIKSAHVAPGYWRNPEATAKAFSHSLNNRLRQHPARVYRTGDMGRRLPDGSIQFEGRKDFQVKIRGHRVELGEIESALAQHQLIREGVVVANENAAGDKRLIAYVVPHRPTSINGELRDFLRQKLPEYMVPSAFVVLDSLPLTASGKLNRRALPAPAESKTGKTFAEPKTHLEKSLAAIWSDVLEIKSLGTNDNFFELGGHSLLAVRFFAQIEKKLGKRLPLATLFQAPTVAQLAAVIQKDWTPDWSSLVPIQPAGSKAPFFCVHALGGNVLEYRQLAQHLGEDQPFYGLQSAGLDSKRAPHTRLEDMAAHYIKEMRELQPVGPYFIGGRSLGGMIAFEMAQQLRAQGEEIGILALLDTYPSGYAKLLREQSTMRGRLGQAANRTKAHLANLSGLSLKDKVCYLVGKSKFAPRKMKSHVWRRVQKSFENLGRPLPRALQDIKELNSLAVREYVPQIYAGHVTLFWASTDLRASVDFVEGWRALAGGGIEVHEIPGSHLDIVKEPHVSELASKLSSCLENAQATQH